MGEQNNHERQVLNERSGSLSTSGGEYCKHTLSDSVLKFSTNTVLLNTYLLQ